MHNITTTHYQNWTWHTGTKAHAEGWYRTEDFYNSILKPIAKDYNNWMQGQSSGSLYMEYVLAYKRLDVPVDKVIETFAADLKKNPEYDSWAQYIPIWGSIKQAQLDFEVGKNGWGTFNSALAISDVFLVKSILQAPIKATIKKGFSEGMSKYFGIGMSHEFGASVSRWKGLGLDMSGYKHHWLISQEMMKKYPILKGLGNQTWNLTKFESQTSHMRWAHFQARPSEGLGKILGAPLMYPFSSTPSWFKFGLMPSLGGRVTEDLNR